ncbi:hypothetical protein A0U40_15990 [[Bacillus] sp. KCTC 13219]|nr:hypothetical protein A0U40_15990 [[Bacillus] sp. KCTC 13219]
MRKIYLGRENLIVGKKIEVIMIFNEKVKSMITSFFVFPRLANGYMTACKNFYVFNNSKMYSNGTMGQKLFFKGTRPIGRNLIATRFLK